MKVACSIWSCVLLLVGAWGCGHRQCDPPVSRMHRAAMDDADLRVAVRACLRSRGEEQRIHVLVLSGGGAYGAWGAGVLSGWREAEQPRSEFDIVTGISTGALLATFAFLGTGPDDEEMKRAFTTTSNDDVHRKRSLLGALFSDSLYTTAPLEALLERYFPDDTIRRVAAAGQTGRRLYVGTVDLDDGTLTIWNMTELAAAGSYDKYRRVILAATAIPVLFPPVIIEGHMHVDGGARSQLFLRKRLLPVLNAVKAEMKAAGREGDSEKPLTVWVLVNGRLGVGPACVDDHILAIAQRSAETLVDANCIGDLYRTKALADEERFRFQLGYYDPISDPVDVPMHEFRPEEMLRLFNQGAAWGRTTGWLDHIPPINEERL